MAPVSPPRAEPSVDPTAFAARAARRALYLPLILTAAVAALVLLQVARLRSSMIEANHVNHATIDERNGHRLLADAVGSLRGYLLTGDTSFLVQAEQAQTELNPVVAQLEQEEPYARGATDAARELRDAAEGWAALTRRAVALRAAGGHAAAMTLDGKALHDAFVGRMRARIDALQRERDAREARAGARARETFVGVAGLALVLGVGIALHVRRDLRRVVRAYARALDDAARARDEAQQASRVQDEFLRTVGHELRTPPSAILSWTTLLRRRVDTETLGTETLRRALDTIARKARELSHTVDDMLDVSRILGGELRLEVDQTDVRTVLDAATASVRPAAEAKRISLEVDVHDGACSLRADARRLQQVFWNLIANAVKFTPSGGRVRVTARRANGAVEIRVSDNGPGVPRPLQEHLFERFRQGDASPTRPHGGIGMGLAIVRHLVELHGGTVRVESPGEEGGATFVVVIPAPPEPPPLPCEPPEHPAAPLGPLREVRT